MKNKFKFLLLIIIGIITFSTNILNTNAAETAIFSVNESTSNRIYYHNNTKYTFYNKQLVYKGSTVTAYCTQLNKKIPSDGTTYTEVAMNEYESYVAGYLIEHASQEYSNVDDETLYLNTQFVLNCLLQDDGFYSSVCSNSEYKDFIDYAKAYVSNNYKYEDDNLPNVSITGNTELTSTGTSGEYVSGKMTLNNLKETYGGDRVTYNLTLSSNVNNAKLYICPSAKYDSTTCKLKSKTFYLTPSFTANSYSWSFYVVVRNGGVDGGNIQLNVKGYNDSTYSLAALWSAGNSVYQKLATLDEVTIARDTRAGAVFSYAASDRYYAGLVKVDTSGGLLVGANLNLFTASDSTGTNKIKNICSISDSVSNCFVNNIISSSENGYVDGNYICYEETKAPEGYIINSNIICNQINIGDSETYYYKDSNQISQTEYDKYNNSEIYCVTRTGEEIDDKYIEDKISEIKTDSTEIYSGECAVIPTINKQSICILNDNNSYITNDNEEYSNCENTEDASSSIGKKYCVTRTSETIDEEYLDSIFTSFNTNGLDGTDNLVEGECQEDAKTYSTSICLYDKTNKGYYEYNEDTNNYNEYCVNTYNLTTFSSKDGNYSIKANNTINKVSISKKAINGNDEIPGATLAIYTTDNSGNCTNTLATSLEFAYQPYVYKVTSGSTEDSGNNSNTSEDNSDGTIENEITNTEDNDDSNTNVDDDYNPATDGLKWTSSYAPVTISGLASGTYCLVEETAPDGYEKITTSTKFSMDDKGIVELVSDEKSSSSLIDGTITLYNNLVEITISKKDIATSKELPGATMAICVASKNNKGKYEVVTNYTGECTIVTLADGTPATWVSTEEEHIVKGLASGTYFLVEQIAPEGYAEAESILFTVDSDGNVFDKDGKSVKDNKIIMYDKELDAPPTGDILLIISTVGGIVAITGIITYLNKNKIFKRNK